MISDSIIANAKQDIVGVIGRYGVKLQKKSANYHALCPFHKEKTPSFTVNDKDKIYYCFGCGAFGDAITFVQNYENLPFRAAVEKITGNLPSDFKPQESRDSYKKEEESEWMPVVPVPADAPMPPNIKYLVAPTDAVIPAAFHSFTGTGGDLLVKHFEGSRYAYRGLDGSLIGYVVRFNCAWGGKDVIPQSWCVNTKTGKHQWRWLSFAKPRPIYGLDKLTLYPNAQVMMVEGEKACDAGQLVFESAGIPKNKLIVLSWAGGSKAIKHTDWSPLAGRSVGLWPDADQKCYKDSDKVMHLIEQIGTTAMLDVADHLAGLAKSIKIILPPIDVCDGWDLADAPPDYFNLIDHLKSNSMLVDDFVNKYKVPINAPDDVPWVDYIAPDLPVGCDVPPPPSDNDKDILLNNGYFTILGYDGNNYFFFHHAKLQILSRTSANFNDIGLMELAPINWWEDNFPGDKGYNKKSALTWLFYVANSRGVYDPSNVRGRGAWIDNGRMVYHHGNKLSVDGEPVSINDFKSGYVYPLSRSSLVPSKQPMTNEEGAKLCQIATMPRWDMEGSAALMAGWVMLAPICGALDWRPHVWLTGPAGSGKAQPHSENVLTPSGWRKMGSLKVGDYVTTPDNGFGKILGVYPQGVQPVYKLTFADGRTTRATGDHLWKVRLHHDWRIITTADIICILSAGCAAAVPIMNNGEQNISKIELISPEECSCIMIDHPDRLYVTNDFVVTHNTTLQEMYCGALTRGVNVYATGDSTEPGIRQVLKGDALPVLIDEFESNNEKDKARVESVINLIRQTSSNTGAKTFKGTVGGGGLRFDVRSMFCLSSINTNLPTKADVDRLTALSLKPPADKGVDNWPSLKLKLKEIDRDATISARLLSRALSLMPIILESIDVFRRVSAIHFGVQRDGDQYGTLLAGCWCLSHDHVPTDVEAVALISRYDWSIHREDSNQNDAKRALEAILAARLRVGTIGEFSVFELVRECSPIHRKNLIEPSLADATMRRHGIRAEFSTGELWFGTSVTPLKQLVEKMSFVTDLRGQLLRIKGATRLVGSRKFNGMDSKVVAIPIHSILELDAADLKGQDDEVI